MSDVGFLLAVLLGGKKKIKKKMLLGGCFFPFANVFPPKRKATNFCFPWGFLSDHLDVLRSGGGCAALRVFCLGNLLGVFLFWNFLG